MNTIFSPNKTSAKLLVDYATVHWVEKSTDSDQQMDTRYLLIYDLYIKARSYALINKIAFWLAIVAAIIVLVWPSLAVISEDLGFQQQFLNSAIVQTTVTGLAALLFALYSHYKKRQMFIENLMRQLVYSDEPVAGLIDKIVKEIERLDNGFGFSSSIHSKAKKSAD